MKMESLSLIDCDRLSNDDFIRIGDIINFEGPLMTLFQDHRHNHLYLFDWVDRDDSTNRWLVYQVDPAALNKFLNVEISHLELFNSIHHRPVFVTDIRHGSTIKNSPITRIKEIPSDYYPESIFFEKEDCPSFGKIKRAVIETISTHSQYNVIIYTSLNNQWSNKGVYINKECFNTNIQKSLYIISQGSMAAATHIRNISVDIQHLIEIEKINAAEVDKKENTLDKIDKSIYAY